ncbi:MAG TPA: amino acid permease [Gammaproteobacteria bacterium]|nr:amino acid permease [Gammaproteobacteria bacterium]
MSFVKSLFRTKPMDNYPLRQTSLRRCLSAFDLTLMGIGAIVGAGIFVLTGIAAATKAGPAVIFSYILSGLACGFTAFAYAELSSSIGGCGSAYGYSFAGLGELIAWLIGWDLLLEYSVACAAVAIGWSGYVSNVFTAIGIPIPKALTTNPFEGGIVNLPAMIIILLLTYLLSAGIRESARINKLVVFIKLAVIVLFIVLAAFHFNPSANWHPFLPFGFSGIASGAALVFFAYIGFDAVSTAAEEAVNPQRDLPRGIIASLLICTLLYIIVAALLTAAVPYTELNVSSPITYALLKMGYKFGGAIVALGAIAGLSTVILVMYYGLTRIFLAMSRDGLLPSVLAAVNAKTQTPIRIIVIAGIVMAIVAGLTPIQRVAELTNIGTLAAFTLVSLGVLVLRYTKPNMPRPFKTPLSPIVPILGILLCGYLMASLSPVTWESFLIWTLIGLVVYFGYSRSRSVLSKKSGF